MPSNWTPCGNPGVEECLHRIDETASGNFYYAEAVSFPGIDKWGEWFPQTAKAIIDRALDPNRVGFKPAARVGEPNFVNLPEFSEDARIVVEVRVISAADWQALKAASQDPGVPIKSTKPKASE